MRRADRASGTKLLPVCNVVVTGEGGSPVIEDVNCFRLCIAIARFRAASENAGTFVYHDSEKD
jgi:hypothetical protein